MYDSLWIHLIHGWDVQHAFMVFIKGAKSYFFQRFFKFFEILISQESSYFSHTPCQILQLKHVLFGRY